MELVYSNSFGSYDSMISQKVPVGVSVSDDSTKVINLLETQEMDDLFNTLRDWYIKGYINKDAATLQENDDAKFTEK